MKIILAAVVAIWMGLGALAVRPAQADDVKVFSAGAVRAIVTDLAEQFRQETGTTVTFSFGTAGQTRQKLLSGEPVDVVILTDAGIDDMIRQGALASGSRADLARTGMGVGVREGAPKPDITTSEAFKTTLLKAKSLVYVDPAQGATSGVHFKSVLERLGIADAVRSKTQLVSGGYPAEKVASGEGYVDPALMPALLTREREEMLTQREREILGLVAEGLSNREIADKLVLSPETVKSHVAAILEKLNVSDRTQAAIYAVRNGLVDATQL